jgi:DNA primase
MNNNNNLLYMALSYHQALPARVRQYLNGRGIPDAIVNSHMLGWNGWRITVPIYDRNGQVIYFKYAKDPEDRTESPKMMLSAGATVELYGWESVTKQPPFIVICEGEFDRLVLEANGFPAVTSTGGAGTFRPEWAGELEHIEQVYVCFDNDAAGKRGAIKVGVMIPQAKIVQLPEEVGLGGDVTDFFVTLKRTREDFVKLLEAAVPVPPLLPSSQPHAPKMRSIATVERVQSIKSEVPIAFLIAHYLPLKISGRNLTGRCPFHEDRTPSLAVYPESGTFHCYGCQKHGDVISFIRDKEKLGFYEALDALDEIRQRYGFQTQ